MQPAAESLKMRWPDSGTTNRGAMIVSSGVWSGLFSAINWLLASIRTMAQVEPDKHSRLLAAFVGIKVAKNRVWLRNIVVNQVLIPGINGIFLIKLG